MNASPITHRLHDNCYPSHPRAEPGEWRWLIHSATLPLDITFTLSTQSCPRFLKVLPTHDVSESTFPTPSCSSSYRSQTRPHPPTHPMEQMLPKVTNDFLVLNPKDTVDHAIFLEIQFPTVFHNTKASCFSFYLSCYPL